MLTHQNNQRFYRLEDQVKTLEHCLEMNLEIIRDLVDRYEALQLRVDLLEKKLNKVYP